MRRLRAVLARLLRVGPPEPVDDGWPVPAWDVTDNRKWLSDDDPKSKAAATPEALARAAVEDEME